MSSMYSPWCNRLMRSLTFSCVVFTIWDAHSAFCYRVAPWPRIFCLPYSWELPFSLCLLFWGLYQGCFWFSYFDLGKLCLDISQVALKGNRVLNLGYAILMAPWISMFYLAILFRIFIDRLAGNFFLTPKKCSNAPLVLFYPVGWYTVVLKNCRQSHACNSG